MKETNNELPNLRKKINKLDREIIGLLIERMELSLRTKRFKSGITDAVREDDVIKQVMKDARNPVGELFIEQLFHGIIDESKRIQALNLKLIGYQGEHGAFGELAARNYDPMLVPIPCNGFKDVVEAVENGVLDYGILPVENSLEGAITEVNDLLIERITNIIGEIYQPITHCLLSMPETDFRDLKVVYSHPQALAQCNNFIIRNKLEPMPFYDTAGAAKMIASTKQRASAAIASRLCADIYCLNVIIENIEDDKTNSTRFLVISRDSALSNGDKCSIVFSVEHRVGALFSVLKIFQDANINLTRIESRPKKKDTGKYTFLLDFMGNRNDTKVLEALEKVKENVQTYKFLGCYTASKLINQ